MAKYLKNHKSSADGSKDLLLLMKRGFTPIKDLMSSIQCLSLQSQ